MTQPVGGPAHGKRAESARPPQEAERKREMAKKGTFAYVIQQLIAMMKKYLGDVGVGDAGLKGAKWLYQIFQRIQGDLQIIATTKWNPNGPVPTKVLNASKDLFNALHSLGNLKGEVGQLAKEFHLDPAQAKQLQNTLQGFVKGFFQAVNKLPYDPDYGTLSSMLQEIMNHSPLLDPKGMAGYLRTLLYKMPQSVWDKWQDGMQAMMQETTFITDMSQIRTSEINFLMQQFQTLGQGANQVTQKQFKVIELMLSLTSK